MQNWKWEWPKRYRPVIVSTNDCRLCNLRNKKSRCHRDCSDIPLELSDMQFLLTYAKNRKRRQSVYTGGHFELLELFSPEKYWGAYENEMKILEVSWKKQHGTYSEFPIIFDSRANVRSLQVRIRKKCLLWMKGKRGRIMSRCGLTSY